MLKNNNSICQIEDIVGNLKATYNYVNHCDSNFTYIGSSKPTGKTSLLDTLCPCLVTLYIGPDVMMHLTLMYSFVSSVCNTILWWNTTFPYKNK